MRPEPLSSSRQGMHESSRIAELEFLPRMKVVDTNEFVLARGRGGDFGHALGLASIFFVCEVL